MKLFDLYTGIGYDVIQKKHTEIDILNRFHLQKLLEGEVPYISTASFFEGSETRDYTQDTVLSLKKKIEHHGMIDLVFRGEDLTKNGHIRVILIVEGMCSIKEYVREEIEWLYTQGARTASFCWNEENLLAAGVKGSPEHGPHPSGEEAPQVMIDCNMLVDVSHASERTFWDITAHSSARVIAMHSNARVLCDHSRNLWDDQIIAIARRGEIIGINSAPAFVHERPEKRDIPHLITHVHHIKRLAGIEVLALGLNYMDFYEGREELHTKNLEDCSKSQRLIEGMLTRSSSEGEARLIANEDVLCKLKEVL